MIWSCSSKILIVAPHDLKPRFQRLPCSGRKTWLVFWDCYWVSWLKKVNLPYVSSTGVSGKRTFFCPTPWKCCSAVHLVDSSSEEGTLGIDLKRKKGSHGVERSSWQISSQAGSMAEVWVYINMFVSKSHTGIRISGVFFERRYLFKDAWTLRRDYQISQTDTEHN